MNTLGRVAFFICYPLIFFYVKVFRVPRTRIIVLSPAGNVLLVKSWFGRQLWALPGGGIAQHETTGEAAVRELYEETGVLLAEDKIRSLGKVTLREGITMDYELFFALSEGEPVTKLSLTRRLEIIDRMWMPVAQAPKEIRELIESRV